MVGGGQFLQMKCYWSSSGGWCVGVGGGSGLRPSHPTPLPRPLTHQSLLAPVRSETLRHISHASFQGDCPPPFSSGSTTKWPRGYILVIYQNVLCREGWDKLGSGPECPGLTCHHSHARLRRPLPNPASRSKQARVRLDVSPASDPLGLWGLCPDKLPLSLAPLL